MRHINILLAGLALFCFATPTWAQDEYDSEEEQLDEPTAEKREVRVKKNVPTRTVKGRVVAAATGEPVAGAMVKTFELNGYSTLTEEDGRFEINVPTFATALQVSAPDYNEVRLGLTENGRLPEIKLYPNTLRGDYRGAEATGFGYSSAVTIEEEIQKQLGADVRTTMRSGTPGVGGYMLVNGINTLNANAQPLVVIDGVVVDQQFSREVLHDGFYNDILSNINPLDIESVEVMRNGTALYGAKGANGVLLIKTRRNKSMATRITASISAGVTLEPKYLDMMNEDQYRSYASEMLQSTNTTLSTFKFLNNEYYWNKYHGNNTDWKKDLYRTAFQQNYGINVEGGDAVANYNLSLGYTNQKSTLKYNSMNRLNIRFNTDIELSKKLSTRFDVSFTNQNRNLRDDGAPSGYDEGTPTSTSFLGYAKSPFLSPYTFANGVINTSHLDVNDEDYLDEALANYSNYNYKLANPLAINEYGEAENKNRFENSYLNIAIKPKYQITPNLFVQEHFSYNLVNTNEKYYLPINGVPNYYVSSVGATRENEVRSLFSKQNSVQSDTRIDWNNHYDAHFIHVMGGARINWETYTINTQLGYNTGNDKTPFISSSLLNAQTNGTNDKWNSLAWYAQADYNYLSRYYLRANLTMEGSSRFGKDADQGVKLFGARWGLFPSLQASWVVTNEKWMADVPGIDYFRLTAGYDISGNDDIDYYAARSYFRSKVFLQGTSQPVSGLTFDNIGNTQIQWETTKRFNAGFDGNFFGNRLGVRFNYFLSHTDHLLTYQTLGFLTGLDQNWGNGGKLKNEGFDVTANYKILARKNWQWELGASMGHYVNKLTELPEGATAIDYTVYGATVRAAVGNPVNIFYGYKTLGVFSTTQETYDAGRPYILDDNGVTRHYFEAGDMHFADLNGDGQINEQDMTVIGDPNPDIYGNIYTTLAYKRFKLDVNFNYSLGNDVYNYMRYQLESGSRFINQTTALTRRWQVEGQQTDIPRITFQDPMGNSRFSDRWIEDGSYLRLKSVTLSYRLPLNSQFIQGLEFWVQGNNLFTLTKYLGSDPEFSMSNSVVSQGIDRGLLPLSRSIFAGVKINL